MSRHMCTLPSGWKRLLILGPVVLAAIVNTGCEGMNHTESGALGGTAVGAGLGALFGHAFGGRGGTAAGAAIGGAAGLVTGAVAGNAMDKREEKHDLAVAQAQAQASTTVAANIWQEVIEMTHNHASDSVIIMRIRASGAVFHLTGEDITNLQAQGVSDAVVNEMQATGSRVSVPTRQVYVRDPVIVEERPVYIYREPPPPIGIGIGYTWRR